MTSSRPVNRSFGLVLPSLEHGISLQIANGANAEAKKHGYGLLIANADNDDILSARYLSYFMGTQVAGILVQPMSVPGWKPSMATPSVPTAYLDFHSDEPGYFVGAANRSQGRLIAQHAIDAGARAYLDFHSDEPGYFVGAANRSQGRLIAQHAIDAGARRVAVFGKNEFEKLGLRIAGIEDVVHTRAGVTFEFIDEGSWNLAQDGYAMRARGTSRKTVMQLATVLPNAPHPSARISS